MWYIDRFLTALLECYLHIIQHLSWVYKSVIFLKQMYKMNHHHSLILEHFHSSILVPPQKQTHKQTNRHACLLLLSTSTASLMCVHSWFSYWLCDPMDYNQPGPLSIGFSGQKYWVGCLAILQGIFPTQEWNLRFLHSLPTEPHKETTNLFPVLTDLPFLDIIW